MDLLALVQPGGRTFRVIPYALAASFAGVSHQTPGALKSSTREYRARRLDRLCDRHLPLGAQGMAVLGGQHVVDKSISF